MNFPRHPSARFVTSAVQPKDYPKIVSQKGQILPEVVVVGRSNVGKSSLLNSLFRTKSLVKTSSTPGKTITLNFFNVSDSIVFVDLPGYGFALRPASQKKQFQEMVENYFKERKQLNQILFLFDIRRLPKEEDIALLKWLQGTGKRVLLVLTKIDKVGRTEEINYIRAITGSLKKEEIEVPYILYSVPKNRGREELINWINEQVHEKT